MNAISKTGDRAHWPTDKKVRHYVELARELGIDVAGFSVSRDGTIRIEPARSSADGAPISDFDRYESEL